MFCANHPSAPSTVTCARCGATFCDDCHVTLLDQYLCAPCSEETLLDLRSGIDLSPLPIAPTGRRILAQIVDGLILMVAGGCLGMVALIPLGISLESLGGSEDAATAVGLGVQLALYGLGFLLAVTYEGAMLAARGQTLGKMALKIKVVAATGDDLEAGSAWGRALLKQGFGILSCCGVVANYAPAFFTAQATCLHDLALKTRVIELDPPLSGPVCPHCGVDLDPTAMASGSQTCPSCSKEFEAVPFEPPWRTGEPIRLSGTGIEDASPCAYHPGNGAELNCGRCGAFICSLCRTEIEGVELCPRCFEHRRAAGDLPSLETRFTNYTSMAISVGAFGLLVFPYGLLFGPVALVTGALALRQRDKTHQSLGKIFLGLALGLAAALACALFWGFVFDSAG